MRVAWYTMNMRLKRFFWAILFCFSTIFLSSCSLPGGRAGLQVQSTDIPASVYLDGELLGKTPYIDKELKPGSFVLRIQPDDSNLASYETTINLKKGLLTVVTWKPGSKPETSGGVIYEMEPSSVRGKSQLSLISIPDRAIVSVDGGEKDFAPLLIEDISPGHHDLEISLPSFETQKHTINVLENHRMLVTVKLAKQENIAANPVPAPTAQPEASASAVATATPSPTPGSVLSASSSASPKPTSTQATAKPRVIINSTNFFVEGKEVLRVRDAVGSAGKELGYAPVGSSYPYLGQTTNNWHQVNFNGTTAWVSGQYSTLEK